ncbi:GGDEF domain-containing protein [Candidatus Daviesbacteria bacterium]|nr:GGDEF domain-containing protein [Candidatus Daviesbacteria bacterium]
MSDQKAEFNQTAFNPADYVQPELPLKGVVSKDKRWYELARIAQEEHDDILANRLPREIYVNNRATHDRQQEILAEQIGIDPLTLLPNRASFDERLTVLVSDARRTKRAVNVLFMDMDRFKEINDLADHDTGDLILQKMAQAMNDVFHRGSDLKSRRGGDEFTAGLVDTDLKNTVMLCRKLQAVFDNLQDQVSAQRVKDRQSPLPNKVTLSIGIAPFNGQDPAALITQADGAMYSAKKSNTPGSIHIAHQGQFIDAEELLKAA